MIAPALLLTGIAMGQEAPDERPIQEQEGDVETPDQGKREQLSDVEEIMITATRTRRPVFEIPRSVDVVDRKRMDEIDALVPLDALKYDVGIFIERRTTSTSDPILRGFAGRNILTLVDGNTLTTLWGEGGDGADDMYGKIDADTVERIEVIRGPASVQYGSNAIGGVINFISRKPALDFTQAGWHLRSRLKSTYRSAANEVRLRGEVHGAVPCLRLFVGGSYHDIDNVEGGRGLGTLDPSDSEARNWDLSAEFIPFGARHLFGLTVQDVHLAHTKRYYRPDQDNFNDREAIALSYTNTAANRVWDELEARFYYQYKKDRRRWLSGDDAGQRGVAKTETLSSGLQLTSLPELPLGKSHRLTYGLHWEGTDGESPDDEQFAITRPDLAHKVKGAPDSIWHNVGGFVQDEWDLVDRLNLITSFRYDWFYFDTHVDEFYQPPLPDQDPNLDQIIEKKGIFSGGVGLLYRIAQGANVFGNYARGFRLNAPNFGIRLLSDVGYLVPNPFLDPITADQFEIGLKLAREGFRAGVAGYYTLIDNQQTITQGTYNGVDFWDENGNGVRDEGELDILNTVAGGKATLKGVETEAECQLSAISNLLGYPDAIGPEWSLRGGFAWEIGDDRQIDGPLRWIHPAYGVAALRYDDLLLKYPFWFELAGTFVRHFDRVVPGLENDPAWRKDPQDRDSGPLRDYVGVPGYTVLDLRGGVEIGTHAKLTLAVENLTDKAYRSAHSRMDAPGINFLASLDLWY